MIDILPLLSAAFIYVAKKKKSVREFIMLFFPFHFSSYSTTKSTLTADM